VSRVPASLLPEVQEVSVESVMPVALLVRMMPLAA
jgi:hypothetical protein